MACGDFPAQPHVHTPMRKRSPLPPIDTPDAVVIGTGRNGVTAAAALVAAGWDVTMLEADGRTTAVAASMRRLLPGRRSVSTAAHKLRC